MSLGGTFAFIRFSVTLLLGDLAWSARDKSLFVSNHAIELLGPQFNDNIGRGEPTMYVVLMLCFWYNIVAWFLSILNSGVLLVYLGLVDLGIVAFALIPAASLQSTYIPHSKITCRSATSWQVSNASEESWFTVLAKLRSPTDPNPEGICKGYVADWISTIVVTVVFSVWAIPNIVAGARDESFSFAGAQVLTYATLHYLALLLISYNEGKVGGRDAGTAKSKYVTAVDLSVSSATHRRLSTWKPASPAARCATRISSPNFLGSVGVNANRTLENKWSA
ncbi:hypothetical protein V496_04099 [Pseudogymnoascus sp. VKM F-4515 (FW-2607)]|nr:hypothetical protein V496_04099 [Pseudogymnoascus sp. VKM F-4515 (FW-2607)]